ncbi:MAG TPA: TonB-dependent receptor, partial [Steroidobacteraceae bacterium]
FVAAALGTSAMLPCMTHAQDADTEAVRDEVVVRGQIVYRDRVEVTPPVLQYGLDYFERFEPLTVGDMLKRVPGVGFLSDVLEYDGVRMRGLDSGYTKVMINGRKVPGSGVDRSFWVDRIPAELVERIEIVRSSSADVSAEGIGGALNIVLKQDSALEGGYLRAGALHFNDDKVKGTLGAVKGGRLGEYHYTLGLNAQGRHNPKSKVTNFDDSDGVFAARELESDVRDGTDYSFNASLAGPLGPAELALTGSFVRTDRTEREDVATLEVNAAGDLELDELEAQDEDIDQRNYTLGARFTLPVGNGETDFELSYARFEDDVIATEFEGGPGDPLVPTQREINDSSDSEIGATLSHAFRLSTGTLKIGLDFLDKQRNGNVTVFGIDGDVVEDDTPPNGIYRIDEKRLDPFVKYSARFGALAIEAGVRFETTDVDVRGDAGLASRSYDVLTPSLHLKWSLSEYTRLYASFARTVRRPDFDLLAPFELEEEPADEDTLRGNPSLEPERAWGVDMGFEHRIGQRGIVGLNLLYRDIDDIVELTSTGEPSGNGGLVFTPQNVNRGKVWGAELDASLPLASLGLENTGVFLNAAWLDSEIDDPVPGGTRRLQNQPDYILNAGFIQSLPQVGAAFGATYRKQGTGEQIVLGETRRTAYGGDLEVFVEKRFGETWVARLAASNLLDSRKIETIRNFDGDSAFEIGENMRLGAVDEFERESEQAGPVWQLVIRASF